MKEFFYNWDGLNVWLFHAINDVRGSLIDRVMQLGTLLSDHNLFAVYLSIFACVILWHLTHRPRQTDLPVAANMQRWLTALAIFSIAYAAEGFLIPLLKHSLDFPRPPLALLPESLHVIGKVELHHSLPSGHANFAMTLAASLWPLLQRKGHVALVIFVLWAGLSRISLGVHFPADVIAGYLLGLIIVLITQVLLQTMLRYKNPPG
jgi:membrane-associated phospholipid phosphatase